jgi:Kdo2-lipid IVA lauroyltransferase/acyltransferase
MAATAVSGLVSILPRGASLALGRALGRGLGALDRRHIAIAVENLRHAFPDWTDERRRQVAHAVYGHFGAVLLDILWMAHRPPGEVSALVDEVVGAEHVERALAGGRGAVLVTAHVGNWELHGLAHGHRFGSIGVVARPLDNPELDRRLCEFRTRGGNSVIYKKRALAQVLRLLRDNRGIALLIDQNVQEGDGIFVDFFARKAATTTVAAALAVKTGAALLPCRTELRPDGRYRLLYDAPLAVVGGADKQAEIARLTQELTRVIEGWIRQAPSQWLWIHRRWKTRPVGEGA